MKLRVGFVTNSSSSSYLIMMKNEVYKTVFATLAEGRQTVLEQIFEDKNAFGIDFKMANWGAGMGGESSISEIDIPESIQPDNYDEDELYPEMIVDQFVDAVKEAGFEVFENSTYN